MFDAMQQLLNIVGCFIQPWPDRAARLASPRGLP